MQAALWLDLKRRYMELRPELRRLYTIDSPREHLGTDGQLAPWVRRLPGDSRRIWTVSPITPCCSTSGPRPIDGWLSRLVARELQIEEDSILDLVQHQLVLDGRRVDLTKLEFDVISYLHERQGTVVAAI